MKEILILLDLFLLVVFLKAFYIQLIIEDIIKVNPEKKEKCLKLRDKPNYGFVCLGSIVFIFLTVFLFLFYVKKITSIAYLILFVCLYSMGIIISIIILIGLIIPMIQYLIKFLFFKDYYC